MIKISGAPKPMPARPAKTMAEVLSESSIVESPIMPPVKIRNPANNGNRIVLNFVLA
jgi:hypothetical protein